MEEVNEYFGAQGYNEEELDVLMILGDADKDKYMTFEEFKKGRSDLQKVIPHRKRNHSLGRNLEKRLFAPWSQRQKGWCL